MTLWETDRSRIRTLVRVAGSCLEFAEDADSAEATVGQLARVQAMVDSLKTDVIRVNELGLDRQWEIGYQQGLGAVNVVCGIYPHLDGIPLGEHHVSLHRGQHEIVGAGYKRVAVELVPVGGGLVTNSQEIQWVDLPAGLITHIGVWTEPNGGDCLVALPLEDGPAVLVEGEDIAVAPFALRVPF